MQNNKLIEGATQSLSFKLVVIGFLTLLLMIPLGMVSSLVGERASNKNSVAEQIYADWSRKQTLQGPILTIPYRTYIKTKKETKLHIAYIHLLPEQLNIDGEVTPSILYRSIYEAVVYKSDLNVKGMFKVPNIDELGVSTKDILFNKASLSFGLSDLRGVQERIELNFSGKKYFFNPGIRSSQVAEVIRNGVSVPISLNKRNSTFAFDFNLKLNGSESLFFLPYGKESVVRLHSSWENPSFIGDFLPDEREVNKEGFQARWSVVDINRAYPQLFKGEAVYKLKHKKEYKQGSKYDYSYGSNSYLSSSFGVNLMVPVDYYQKSSRSIKYGSLIIILTFLALFFVEIFLKKRIHGFQYILIGIGLILFFALLISLSEHIGFDAAYIVSALVTIALITLYSKSVFKNMKFVLMLFGILFIFYAFIYILLQLQDYSLLLGVVMLFGTLASIMYISRDIDWYNIAKETQASKE